MWCSYVLNVDCVARVITKVWIYTYKYYSRALGYSESRFFERNIQNVYQTCAKK